MNLPSKKESIIAVSISLIFGVLTAIFVGLRPEHYLILGLFLILFFINTSTRKLAVGLIPFILFGVSYDWMRVFPNYLLNTIDVENLYNLEKSLFGVTDNGVKVILCEYFAAHTSTMADFLSGVFYFAWVPVPVAFALYLYVSHKRDYFLRFSLAFLFVNLLGFSIYYIYPAAPPWYAMEYGFEPILNTPGNMAGLSRFDALIGFDLFGSIYGRNANVFAAVPSLHSAYLLVAAYYARKSKCSPIILVVISLFLVGIWFTAVYTAHHYIIDVLLGILCAILGIFIFEKILMKLSFFRSFFTKYNEYIA